MMIADTSVLEAARGRIMSMIDAAWMCQAIGVACELELAERLAAEPRTALELAASVQADADAVARLLRGLSTLGLCEERGDGRFALTPDGHLLRGDAPLTVRGWARMSVERSWANWAGLGASVRTGKSVRQRAKGALDFSPIDADPVASEAFNRGMASLTRPVALAAARLIDWSAHRRVVDVGAGPGELVATLLERHPHLAGVAFDLRHAVEPARQRLGRSAVDGRCEVVSGSFFEAVPRGADAYLLKSVLHNWDDERAAAILGRVREAMAQNAVLYVFERIVPARYSGSAEDRDIARSDLNMLVACDGRERSVEQFRRLLDAAHFSLVEVGYLHQGVSALRCVPRPC